MGVKFDNFIFIFSGCEGDFKNVVNDCSYDDKGCFCDVYVFRL